MTSVESYAFFNCTKLIKVYYSGTEEQWDDIYFGDANNDLFNAEIIFNSNRKSESIHRKLESMKLTKNSDNIEVEGHIGTWYVIDTMITPKGEKLFLLEHEEYGDETACVIVDENGNLIMEDVWNGFEDLEEDGYLEENMKKENFVGTDKDTSIQASDIADELAEFLNRISLEDDDILSEDELKLLGEACDTLWGYNLTKGSMIHKMS